MLGDGEGVGWWTWGIVLEDGDEARQDVVCVVGMVLFIAGKQPGHNKLPHNVAASSLHT